MVGVIWGTSCAPPDNETGLELSDGTRTGATTTVVVIETTFLRGEALADAAIKAAVAMGETSVLVFRLRDDVFADVDAGADASVLEAAGVAARVTRFVAGGVLEVDGLVAALATVFLTVFADKSVPTVFGVTLFFIAILYKTEFTSLWWVNEMGIKTAQSSRGLRPRHRSFCNNNNRNNHNKYALQRSRCQYRRGANSHFTENYKDSSDCETACQADMVLRK